MDSSAVLSFLQLHLYIADCEMNRYRRTTKRPVGFIGIASSLSRPRGSGSKLSLNKNEEGEIKEGLDYLLLSKIGTGLLALTYVSGYLIATSYLGTYHIPIGANGLFRAKYIYIGFQYWMFVTIFAAIFRALSQISFSLTRPDRPLSAEERKKVAGRIVEEERAVSDISEPHDAQLIWKIVIAMILVVFSIEIMLLNPRDLRDYLSWQSIFLLSLLLYLRTYHREYSPDSYTWGLVYGRRYVKHARWFYPLGIGGYSTLVMTGTALYSHLDQWRWYKTYVTNDLWLGWPWKFWLLGWLLIFLIVIMTFFVMLRAGALKWLDDGIFNRKSSGSKGKQNAQQEKHGKWRLFLNVMEGIILGTIAGFYCWIALDVLHGARNVLLEKTLAYGTMLLALLVLASIVTGSIMYDERGRDLSNELQYARKKENLSAGQRSELREWERWIQRAVPVVILYIVSVLGFAYYIYPFIPIQKAGGNYSDAEPIYVNLRSATTCSVNTLKGELDPTGNAKAMQFILLDEDANSIYLAPDYPAPIKEDRMKNRGLYETESRLYNQESGNGPSCWKWGVFCGQEHYRPKVYSVNRRCVADMESVN